MKNSRLEELDSLRGLAALTVVFGHYLSAALIDHKTLIEYGPARIFISANEAVLLFFLLSGFVLILPFIKKETYSLYDYSNFVIKRVLRIYIPYLVAIILAIFARVYFYTGELNGYSTWFNDNWKDEVTTKSIIDHIIFLGEYAKQFNTVTWSLVEEMRVSLVFPLIAFLIIKSNWKTNMAILVAMYIFSVIGLQIDMMTTIAKSLMYASIFYTGGILSKYRLQIIDRMKNISNLKQWFIILIAIGLYLYAKPSFVANSFWGLDTYSRISLDYIFTISGAALIVMSALSFESKFVFLKWRIVKFFGEISYSLYLYHVIVLLSFAYILDGRVNVLMIYVLSFVFTVFISYCSYKYVEKPFIKIASKIVNKRNENKLRTIQLKNN